MRRSPPSSDEAERRGRSAAVSSLRPALLFLLVAGAVLAGRYLDLPVRLREVLDWIEHTGWTGIALFVLLYVAACVFFLPGAVLSLGAGIVFGLVKGTILVSFSATLGATAAFLVGRYLAGDWNWNRADR